MNIFCLTGNIGSDAEVRQVGNGSVCNFTVAVKSGYGDRQKTEWVRCALWGKRAEGGLPAYLVKGAQVAVSGELSTREYDSGGQTKTSLEVNVNDVTLVGGKQSGAGSSQPSAGAGSPPPGNNQGDGFEDDDIPF